MLLDDIAKQYDLREIVLENVLAQNKQIPRRNTLKGVDVDNNHVEELVDLYNQHVNEEKEKSEKIMAVVRAQYELEHADEIAQEKELAKILITSGFSFDGYKITKYSGYISGDDAAEIPRGTALLGLATENNAENLTGILVKIRRQALKELKQAAYDLGCNAVIGVDFDYLTLEPETASITGKTTYLPYVICVTANGNAVIIEKTE